MSSIDKRIVQMEFDHAQFNQGVDSTLNALQNLQNGLKLDHIASDVDNISSKMTVLGAVSLSAINKIVDWSMSAGAKIASNILDPIIAGGRKRSLNLEHSFFQLEGLLAKEENAAQQVEAIMANVNTAVDGTAYGLDAAAVAASQFAASGMRAGKDMENALRGISGVAAMAGSSYEDIADIFTTVSGQGKLMTMDMRRLESRGINAAATLGDVFQKTEAEIRDMVTKGQVSFEMFAEGMNTAFGDHATKANETYAGSLSNVKAALARVGQQYFRGTDVSTSAGHLERQRKIFVSLIPVINGVAGATAIMMNSFNKVQNLKNDGLVKFIESFGTKDQITEKLTPSFENLGGAIEAFYAATQSYLAPIKEAFRDIFPKDPEAPSFLLMVFEKLTGAIKSFAEALVLGATGQNVLYIAFRTFFQTIKIGIGLIKLAWEGIKLLGQAFLIAAQSIGKALQPVTDWFKNLISGFKDGRKAGDTFFEKLTSLTEGGLSAFAEKMAKASESLKQFNAEKVIPFLDRMRERLEPLIERIRAFDFSWEGVKETFAKIGQKIVEVYNTILPYLQKAWDFVKTVAIGIKDALSTLGLDGVLKIIQTGGFIALVKALIDTNKSLSGIVDGVKNVLKSTTEALNRFNSDMPKPKKIFLIALSLLALAVALKMLSDLDAGEIVTGLGAMMGILGILVGAIYGVSKALETIGQTKGIYQLAGSLILLGIGLFIFAKAVKNLSTLSWEELAKGLLSIAIGLRLMTKTLLAINKKDILQSAAAIFVVAVALIFFAMAIKMYAKIPWETMWGGLARIGVSLLGLTIALKALNKLSKDILRSAASLFVLVIALGAFLAVVTLMSIIPFPLIINGLINVGLSLMVLVAGAKGLSKLGPDLAKTSLALIPMAAALLILSFAIAKLSKISFWGIAKGMTALIIGLEAMVMALEALSTINVGGKRIIAMAVAVGIVAVSLYVMGRALERVAQIPWVSLGTALFSLTVTLGIIVGALYALEKIGKDSKRTAVRMGALLGMIAGIYLLGMALDRLGSLSWWTITKALGAVAVAFTYIGAMFFAMSRLPGEGHKEIMTLGSLIGAIAALYLLGIALEKLGGLDAATLTKGLIAMTVALVVMGGVMFALGSLGALPALAAGAAMALGGAGLWLVAEALLKLGEVNWGQIESNLGVMAAALLIITGGSLLASLGALGAATIGVAARGMHELADAMKAWNGVSIPEGIGFGLTRLAAGIFAFTPAIIGAFAAIKSGEALRSLALGLAMFGQVEIPPNIGKSLETLADGIRAFTVGDILSAIGALVSGAGLQALGDAVRSWQDLTVAEHLGEDLERLASGIGAFSETSIMDAITGLVAGNALERLAQSVIAWQGVEVNPAIEEQLVGLATGIGAFDDHLMGAIAALISEASIGDLADSVRAWEGVQVNPAIEEQLIGLGNGIAAFNEAIIGAISAAIVDDSIGKLAEGVRKWEGISLNTAIEEQLQSLANGISAFNWQFFGSGNLGKVIQPLKDLAQALVPWQTLKVPSTIEQDLTAVADGVTAFSPLGYIVKDLPEIVEILGTVPPALFGFSRLDIPLGLQAQFESLASGIEALAVIPVDSLVSLPEPLNNLGNSLMRWSSINIPSSLGNELISLGAAIETFSKTKITTTLSGKLLKLNFSLNAFGVSLKVSSSDISGSSSTIKSSMSVVTTAVNGVTKSLSSSGRTINNSVNSINKSVNQLGKGANVSLTLFATTVVTQGRLATTAMTTTSRQFTIQLSILRAGVSREGRMIVVEYNRLTTQVQSGMIRMLSVVNRMSGLIVRAMSQMGSGISSAARTAANAINGTVASIVSGAIARLNAARGQVSASSYAIGLAVGQGMANGINAGRSLAISAAASVAGSALAAAKSALDVRSPSRKAFKIGGFFSLGLAGGIIQNESNVRDASEKVAEAAILPTLKMVDQLQGLIDDGLIEDPVITPVLNLDDIQKQVGAMGNILDRVGMVSSIEAIGREYDRNRELRNINAALFEPEPAPQYNFVQNNTSPKALSPADIYRQTRNQLSMARQGIYPKG